MPKTRQEATKRKAYSVARTVNKPYTAKEMLSPFKTMSGRKRTVYGDKKK